MPKLKVSFFPRKLKIFNILWYICTSFIWNICCKVANKSTSCLAAPPKNFQTTYEGEIWCWFTNGQIEWKAGLSRRRFFQKTNEQIWFVCCEKQKSKLNKFIGLFVPFLGEPTARKSAFGFIWPYDLSWKSLFLQYLVARVYYSPVCYSQLYGINKVASNPSKFLICPL